MADEDETQIDEDGLTDEEGDGEEGEGEGAPKRRRLSGRKLVLFVIAPLLAVGLAGAGAYFSGLFDGGEEAPEVVAAKPKVFFDLPEMLVNLADRGEDRARYLKLQVALELPGREARDALTPVLPRVIDLFQVYLRELRSSDLVGSAGIFRLKEELLRRINLEIQPHEVNDVLFKEIIVQ